MRVAVMSDLHIGVPPVGGAFGHRAPDFARFLRARLDDHDHVVLNGDVLQTDHTLGWGPAAARAALERGLAHHGWLADLLENPRLHYLHGNHDAVAAELLGAPTLKTFGDGRLVVTHGDAFDPVIGRAPGVSAAATWASGRIRRLGLHALATALEGRDIAIKGQRFGGREGPYAQGARALLQAHGAEVCVMGHTHVPCEHALPEGIYVNPGSCSLGWRAWVSVDLDAGDVVRHAARAS